MAAIKSLFADAVHVSNRPAAAEDLFDVNVTIDNASQVTATNLMVAVYVYNREKLKNYYAWEPIKPDHTEYVFKNLPKGYYDIRIATYTIGIGYTYDEVYRVSKHFVGTPADKDFTVRAVLMPIKNELLVELSRPAGENDYIGIFECGCVSMNERYMVGLSKNVFGHNVLERSFDVKTDALVPNKEYEVRYFRGDCMLQNGMDKAYVPFAFSNQFTL